MNSMKLILLVSGILPCQKFISKLENIGFDFEKINLNHFLRDHTQYKHSLFLLPALFADIVDINLIDITNHDDYNFILISNKLCQHKETNLYSKMDINIIDIIERNAEEQEIKELLNTHLNIN